jgi:probable F420-dependent oxidoreductase
VFDEALQLLRLLLTEQTVSFSGRFFTVDEASVGPLPAKPLDIWLGGSAPGALRRVGRLADGWLASFVTPAEAAAGRAAIKQAAAQAGREVEEDHYGISLAVAADGDIPEALIAAARQRRPDADPAGLVATSWPDARRMIAEYVDAGLTKFVIRPADPKDSFQAFLDRFVAEMIPLQT